MRTILGVIAAISVMFAGPSAHAQEPYHVFNFAPPAGHYQIDDDVVGQRLRSGKPINGDVILSKCAELGEFKAGFRLRVSDDENRIFVGFICDPDTGELFGGYRRFVGGQKTEELKIQKIGKKGDRIKFRARILTDFVIVEFGSFKKTFTLNFTPSEITYYGFGATGQARFFELEPLVS